MRNDAAASRTLELYAWFRDLATAREYQRFVESLVARRPARPDVAEHMATTHALALGGAIVLHPSQRQEDGYAVPLMGCPRVVVYRGLPWWRRLLHQVALTLLVAAAVWLVGAFIWFVERGLAW